MVFYLHGSIFECCWEGRKSNHKVNTHQCSMSLQRMSLDEPQNIQLCYWKLTCTIWTSEVCNITDKNCLNRRDKSRKNSTTLNQNFSLILKFILAIITKADWNDRFKSTIKYKLDHGYLKHDFTRHNFFFKLHNRNGFNVCFIPFDKFIGACYKHTSPNTYTHIETHRGKINQQIDH